MLESLNQLQFACQADDRLVWGSCVLQTTTYNSARESCPRSNPGHEDHAEVKSFEAVGNHDRDSSKVHTSTTGRKGPVSLVTDTSLLGVGFVGVAVSLEDLVTTSRFDVHEAYGLRNGGGGDNPSLPLSRTLVPITAGVLSDTALGSPPPGRGIGRAP